MLCKGIKKHSGKHLHLCVCVTETVALFDYVGLDFYTCDPASGYVCNKESETVFSVTTPCAPDTKFSFFAEGEKALPCMSIQSMLLSLYA